MRIGKVGFLAVAVAAAHRGRQGLSSSDRPCLQRDAKPRCGAIAPENSTDLSHMLPQLGGASSKRSVVTVTLIVSSTISQLGADGRRYNLGIRFRTSIPYPVGR